jgi:hypothetical protein
MEISKFLHQLFTTLTDIYRGKIGILLSLANYTIGIFFAVNLQ